jgi:hypothetical protein
MHHYSVTTSLTLASLNRLDIRKVWQTEVPKEAQSSPFLMHGILAISALHISQGEANTSSHYHKLARDHKALALSLFHSTVVDVHPSNGKAIWAFALILLFLEFGLALEPNTLQGHGMMETHIGLLTLLRASHLLLRPVMPWLAHGTFSPEIKLNILQIISPDQLEEDVTRVIETLGIYNNTLVIAPDEKNIFEQAIQELGTWLQLVPSRPADWSYLIRFPLVVQSEYVNLLQRKHPMALVIFAHWCPPVYHAPYKWFITNWSKRVVAEIWNSTPLIWRPALLWPMKEVGLDVNLEEMALSIGD